MASPARLLHLPFKDPDGTDGHVLVRVTPTSDDPSSSSSSPLNLELLATQGTEAFVLLCKFSPAPCFRPIFFLFFCMHCYLQVALSILSGPACLARLPRPLFLTRFGRGNGATRIPHPVLPSVSLIQEQRNFRLQPPFYWAAAQL